ncbi:MAG: hypothetical protein U0234_17140 [Sandaracinus sp.]
MRSLRLALALVALLSVLSACGGSSYAMRPSSTDEPPAAVEGQALVVFVMPTSGRDTVSIVDELGVYLGQLRGHAWFSRAVAPGDHRFYALEGSSASVVHATGLEAGRVYFVRAEDPVFGVQRFLAGGCDAAALTGTHRTEADPAASQASIDRQLGNVPQRTLEADGRFERMSEADRTARTLVGACP